MRMRRRPPALLLSLAVTLAVSATVYSRTPEDALIQQAEQGDQQARLDLATLYTARDQLDLAVAQLQAAASEGNRTAHALLAEHFGKQHGLPHFERARRHAQAAGDDYLSVVTRLGVIASLRAIDQDQAADTRRIYADAAVELLNPGSIAGDPNAKWHLGYLHLTGVILGGDRAAGMALVQNAADAGHMVAAQWLAHTYDTVALTGKPPAGLDVPAYDVKAYAAKQALYYLKQAAAAGSSMASTQLAGRYASGRVPGGVPDPDRAERILAAAVTGAPAVAASAFAHAGREALPLSEALVRHVGDPQLTMASASATTPPVLPPAVVDHQRVLDERDNTIRQLRSELDAAHSRIAQLDRELSEFRTYQAALHSAEIQNRKGLEYFANSDYESALPLFRKAAELDHSGAIANLAMFYLNGYVVPQDTKQAARLLQRASDLGNLVATENLAELYETGAGLGRDPSRAITWYRRAEALGSVKASDALVRLGAGPHQ